MTYHLIKKILDTPALVEQELTIKGWVRSLRKSKTFSFIVLNDGSTQNNIQVVVNDTIANYAEVSSMIMGYCIRVKGKLVKGQGKVESVEVIADEVEIYGKVDQDYPIQKKSTSLEFLRDIAHMRVRTNTFSAVFRVRHAISFATHKFFHENNLFYVNTPITTGSDCEGAGQMFRVTTLDMDKPEKLPTTSAGGSAGGLTDFSKDFYGKSTYLTVSGQLNAECLALGLRGVYTFGPTFRAENSNTPRHLSEFWMIEPEISFYDLDDLAEFATNYIKYLISFTLDTCDSELKFLEEREGGDKNLRTRLKNVKDASFTKVTYTEAIKILEAAEKKQPSFEFKPAWGIDLQTEHERYLTEKHFGGPVIVTDYPKEIKAFYMKLNSDNKTVRAMDILVPGIGEMIGGSQREDNYDKLVARIKDMGLNEKDYSWYLDLRKFGSAPHSGFGLGLERACMYITGMTNIRDVIPFPRFPKNAEF